MGLQALLYLPEGGTPGAAPGPAPRLGSISVLALTAPSPLESCFLVSETRMLEADKNVRIDENSLHISNTSPCAAAGTQQLFRERQLASSFLLTTSFHAVPG